MWVIQMKKTIILILLISLFTTVVLAMNKADLIEAISRRSDLTEEQAETAMDVFFDIVVDTAQRHDPGVAILELSAITKRQKIKAGFLMDEAGHQLGAKEGDVVLVAIIRPSEPDSTIAGRKTVRPHDFILYAKKHHFVESITFGDGIRGSRPAD